MRRPARAGCTSGRCARAWLTEPQLVLITDESGPVTPDQLSSKVAEVIEKVSPEQLIVYFAGHGTILRRSEH